MISQTDMELLERYIDGTIADGDAERLRTLLRDSADARAALRSLATIDFGLQDMADSRGSLREPTVMIAERSTTLSPTIVNALLAIAAAIIVALAAGLYFQRASTERQISESNANTELQIAKIAGLGGSVVWTGDGGQVSSNLSVGTALTGGTIEGTTPDSWVELEFVDGSTVMISGNSMLTFSDFGQKELHLKKGNASANVNPQAPDKPMLVYTDSAQLEVLGTQFKVETKLASTALNVNEGKVRVKRLSDGRTVDVPANHRVVAAAELELSPETIPNAMNRWKSQLHLGPDGTMGKWSPKTEAQDARLKAILYVHTTPQGEPMSVYTAGMQVSVGDNPPVILQSGSQIRVRGRLASAGGVTFGVTVRHPDGGFGGNFFGHMPAIAFADGQDFDVRFDISALNLDPALAHIEDELAAAPIDVVVETFWCATVESAGLEIVEVEMLEANSTMPHSQASN